MDRTYHVCAVCDFSCETVLFIIPNGTRDNPVSEVRTRIIHGTTSVPYRNGFQFFTSVFTKDATNASMAANIIPV